MNIYKKSHGIISLVCAALIVFTSTAAVSCGESPNNDEITDILETSSADETENTAQTERVSDMKSYSDFSEDILNTAVSKSSSDHSEKSEKPNITVYKHITNTKFFIGGKVAPNALVNMRGGVKDLTFTPDDDNFWGAVDLPKDGVCVITVTAQENGKAESDPISFTIKARNDIHVFENHGIYGVIVGNDFQGHFQDSEPDYVGSNLLNKKTRTGVVKAMEKKVQTCEKNGAKLLFLLIPNPMNIYPETVPEEYVRSDGDSLTAQFSEIAESAGADVIYLKDEFLQHRDDEFKLFNKMDSHWTEYGAYHAYLSLTDYLSQDFPDAIPRDASMFKFYKEDRIAGDMATHLEITNKYLHEMTTVCDLLFESPYDPDFFMIGKNEVEHTVTQNAHTVVNKDKTRTLPKAMIYRDSFSSAIEAMANDTFSTVYWQDMWNYELDGNTIKRTGADYVIYLIAERNIKNIMY